MIQEGNTFCSASPTTLALLHDTLSLGHYATGIDRLYMLFGDSPSSQGRYQDKEVLDLPLDA